MRKCIILANGHPPTKRDMDYLIRTGFNTLICADGGANTAAKLGIVPDFIIGDFDSINPKVFNKFEKKCKMIKISRQTDTDVEKCIKYAVSRKFNEVVLLGATGDRLDHTFGNLGIVLKYFKKITIRILHQKSYLSAYTGSILLDTHPEEIISVYGIDTQTVVSSTGLKYPLINLALPFGKKESTSNVALGEKVVLKIKNGVAFVIRDFGLMKKYDLFK